MFGCVGAPSASLASFSSAIFCDCDCWGQGLSCALIFEPACLICVTQSLFAFQTLALGGAVSRGPAIVRYAPTPPSHSLA